MTERILPEYENVSVDDMRAAVFQALGAASMCWGKGGIFDSERAVQIGEELLEIIDTYGYQNS